MSVAIGLRSVVRAAQLDRDSRKTGWPDRRASYSNRLGADPHQFLDALDFRSCDPDSALPLRASLEVIDRGRLTADDEKSAVRLSEPVVKARDRNSESARDFCR